MDYFKMSNKVRITLAEHISIKNHVFNKRNITHIEYCNRSAYVTYYSERLKGNTCIRVSMTKKEFEEIAKLLCTNYIENL